MTDLPGADIKAAGYENIYFDCPTCKRENVINRVTDLDPMAITSGMEFKCQFSDCGKALWLKGDFIQPAVYEWFLFELPVLKTKKLYRDYALSLCQAAESFFLRAIINKKFDRNPDYRNELGGINLSTYNPDKGAYETSIRDKTYAPMREEFLTVFQGERDADEPRPEHRDDDRRSWAFDVIQRSSIGNLRNRVVHKTAYRPKLSEIEEHEDLVKALHWLGRYLQVLDSKYWLNRKI
ncbi:MAG TPA: hypothetical protein VL989_03080 [Candidatus Sulfotelmatobacter sp.]|nr:hypothetical protein [Candidatus Sulfotelmatobacter sp.]